jgi:hypothetical protein
MVTSLSLKTGLFWLACPRIAFKRALIVCKVLWNFLDNGFGRNFFGSMMT